MLKKFPLIIALLFIISFMGIFILSKHNEKLVHQDIEKKALEIYEEKNLIFTNRVSAINDKLDAIIQNKIFEDFLINGKNKDFVDELFLSLLRESKDIFQLRYINSTGKEIVRVDKNDDKSIIVSKNKLQDKSDRYYFNNTMNLETSKNTWYSNIDLNIENGKIELPYKETLRVAKQIVIDNQKVGIVIVNLKMNELLDSLVKADDYDIYLLDKDNYILTSNLQKYDWSRYLNKDRFDVTLFNKPFSKNLDLNTNEKLKLIIDIKEGLEDERHFHKDITIIFGIIILDVIILFILFIIANNIKLKVKVEEAIKKEKESQSTINSYIAMTKIDLEGNITYVADEFSRLVGYSKEELLGKSHNILNDQNSSPEVCEKLWETIKKGESFKAVIPTITKTSEKLWFELTVVPQFNSNGEIFEYVALRRNITDKILTKRANELLEEKVAQQTKELLIKNEILQENIEELATTEEELRNQQDELIESHTRIIELTNAKERFLSNMSHELRTPLNGIVGIIDMLYNHKISDDFIIDKMNNLKKSSNILINIVNDILDFSSLQSGNMKLFAKEFMLKDVLDYIRHMFQKEFDEKQVKFKITVRDDVERVLIGDEIRITQILLNLISNAKKFTKSGYVALNISCLEKDYSNIKLRIEVEDTGIGMSESFQSNLFNEFTQADISNTKEYKGTGLGLSIVKKLIELMNGKIFVKSKINEGTSISMQLDLPFSRQEIATSKEKEFIVLSTSKKVLLVEDDEINQMVLKSNLKKRNFEVDVVDNGLEAVNRLKEDNSYDIIFTDIQMPVMDGHEAAIKIREFNKDIPIIAISAGVLEENIQESLNAGMDMHIMKPLDNVQLNEVIDKYLS